jgi:hypothetical protein
VLHVVCLLLVTNSSPDPTGRHTAQSKILQDSWSTIVLYLKYRSDEISHFLYQKKDTYDDVIVKHYSKFTLLLSTLESRYVPNDELCAMRIRLRQENCSMRSAYCGGPTYGRPNATNKLGIRRKFINQSIP